MIAMMGSTVVPLPNAEESNGGINMEKGKMPAAAREALRQRIAQWNANRLDLFEISEPNEVSILGFKYLVKY